MARQGGFDSEKFILWLKTGAVDYGHEMWRPIGFQTSGELLMALSQGITEGKPFVVTKPVELVLGGQDER